MFSVKKWGLRPPAPSFQKKRGFLHAESVRLRYRLRHRIYIKYITLPEILQEGERKNLLSLCCLVLTTVGKQLQMQG